MVSGSPWRIGALEVANQVRSSPANTACKLTNLLNLGLRCESKEIDLIEVALDFLNRPACVPDEPREIPGLVPTEPFGYVRTSRLRGPPELSL